MDIEQAKCSGIAAVNSEIIGRLESKQKVVTFLYTRSDKFEGGYPIVSFEEHRKEQEVQSVLSSRSFRTRLQPMQRAADEANGKIKSRHLRFSGNN